METLSPRIRKFLKVKLYMRSFTVPLLFLLAASYLGYKSYLSQPPVSAPWDEAQLYRLVQDLRFSEDMLPAITQEQIKLARLGRVIFFDRRFSANQQISCANCHQPDRYFTDGIPQAIGIAEGAMNTPTIVNSFAAGWLFWDGRADSLEAQALMPMQNHLEHGIQRWQALRVVEESYLPLYTELFGAFPSAALAKLPFEEERPLPQARNEIPLPLATYVMASNLTLLQLSSLLSQASQLKQQPAEILQKLSAESSVELERDHPWLRLDPSEANQINEAFLNLGRAIAAFERGIVSYQSPFDAFAARLNEDQQAEDALNADFGPSEVAGLRIFLGKGQCRNCHHGPLLSDGQFHNIGLPEGTDIFNPAKWGRARGAIKALHSEFPCESIDDQQSQQEHCREKTYLDTENFENLGAFKTPSLRNVAMTAPYMHDGRFAKLREVLEHYNKANTAASIGHREESLIPLGLNEKDLDDLEAFLKSLTAPVRVLWDEH